MNFQAVSVGQKLAKDKGNNDCVTETDPVGLGLKGQAGGYVDGAGTPSNVLQFGLDKTDAALQSMISELQKTGQYESTLIVITAKHGQSPINPVKVNKPGHFADLVATLPDASSPAGQAIASAAACGTGACGLVQDDDVALIWLQDQKQTAAVADYLNKNAAALFIDEVLSGDELKLKFNNPAIDSRTPDIIVQPQYGTIYTGSSKKNAEHGGMSYGDTNVGLILSNPHLSATTIKTPVTTAQVAPTILGFLDMDADDLDAVRVEHTQALPGALTH
jgi:arylsulfatase A-like enzyme